MQSLLYNFQGVGYNLSEFRSSLFLFYSVFLVANRMLFYQKNSIKWQLPACLDIFLLASCKLPNSSICEHPIYFDNVNVNNK